MRPSAAALAGLALLAAKPGLGADIDTSIRGSFWSKDQDLSGNRGVESLQFWLRASEGADVGDASLNFRLEGWASWKGGGAGSSSDRAVRQAYGQFSDGEFELRAGWQMYAWGRVDGINPTDNLTPHRYTLLVRDSDDQRIGTPSVRATWYDGTVSSSLIWLASFKPSTLPGQGTSVDLAPTAESRQFAARIEMIRDEIEGSLSYFGGYDVMPSQATFSPGDVEPVLLSHDRLRIIGADFAKPIGRFILRGETAYTATPDATPSSVFALRPQWYSVVSGEQTFGEYLDVEIQFYYRKVHGSPLAQNLSATDRPIAQELAVVEGQYDPVDRGFTARVADQWLNETVEGSVSLVFSTVRKGFEVKPTAKYKVADNWTLTVGAVIAGGDELSPYGILKANNALFFELRRGF